LRRLFPARGSARALLAFLRSLASLTVRIWAPEGAQRRS